MKTLFEAGLAVWHLSLRLETWAAVYPSAREPQMCLERVGKECTMIFELPEPDGYHARTRS